MKPRTDPHPFLSPLAAGTALLAPALVALITGRITLFASLGPTAVMQAHEPRHKSSRLYSVVVSHLVGFVAGSAVVLALGLGQSPSVFDAGHVSAARAAAVIISVVVGTAAELALRAAHPPGAATTLLVAVGSIKPTLPWLMYVAIGVIATGCAGEVIRQIRCRLEA